MTIENVELITLDAGEKEVIEQAEDIIRIIIGHTNDEKTVCFGLSRYSADELRYTLNILDALKSAKNVEIKGE